jgi:flotillin
MIATLIIIGVAALVVLLTVVGLLSRYKRAAPNELLVVFGKAGKLRTEDGKTVVTPSKIIQGGGTFVWPIIQDFQRMSMQPIQITITVDGIDSQAIPMHLPVVLTTAISQDKMIQQNAATRFLSAPPGEVQKQISEILKGETRAIMATMLIEDINADRNKFLTKVRENLETELTKVGYELTNINISEITDDADYIKNLGKKAATKAKANAEADIAEQEKQGNVKIANTKKEEDIAVAEAERDKQINVNQTKQEQEIRVAEIEREKAVKIAEALKDQESGVAQQEAEKTAAIAKSVADGESKKAAAEAEQKKNIAKSQNDAIAAEQEAVAQKEIRVAKAIQEKDAETNKAVQEKEAKIAEYESQKRQKKADADRKAGVAEQEAKIDVAKATGRAGQAEADALRVTQQAKVQAEMDVRKTEQEKQLEVNSAKAKAVEKELEASEIIPAQKEKERIIIEAEGLKQQAILDAQAQAAKILEVAKGEAAATQMKLEAEAEGNRKKLLADAEGAEAMALAKAHGIQQEALAEAMAFERMIEAAGSPEMAVSWKMADKWEGIAGAQALALSKVNLGNVTVYGDKNTGAQFAKSLLENLAPALTMVNDGLKDNFKQLFSKDKNPDGPENPGGKPSLPTNDGFEEVGGDDQVNDDDKTTTPKKK